MTWSIYILQCNDESYYVGHSIDVVSRLTAHNKGQGAIFTATRRPCRLVYQERLASKEAAVKREQQLKKWTRTKKQALIDGDIERLRFLAKKTLEIEP